MKASLYLHVPFCVSKCHYCDFFSVPCSSISDEYVDALCNEIEERRKEFSVSSWKTVYIGGGTPSLLRKNQLNQLIECIQKNIENGAEFTIEVNPDDVTKDLLLMLENTCVNRISCGIQAYDDEVLKFMNRRSSLDVIKKALDLFKHNWDKKLSLDLISALPKQTEESFLYGLNKIIEYKPEHISLYSLTVEEETRLGKMVSTNEISYDFDAADEMWISGKNLLIENGYIQYEVSNFALNHENISKHNLSYWKTQDYIGVGSGATGTVYGNLNLRYTNTKNIDEYVSFWKNNNEVDVSKIPQVNENLSEKDLKFEFFMMGLRTEYGIKFQEYKNRFFVDINRNIVKLMENWKAKGLAVLIEDESFCLNEDGLVFLNDFLYSLLDCIE